MTDPTNVIKYSGGDFTKEVLDKCLTPANANAADELKSDFTENTVYALAAMIVDQMQEIPRLLNFVDQADQKMFDFSRFDKPVSELTPAEITQMWHLRNEALRSVRSVMGYARSFVKASSTYLTPESDDDVRRFKALLGTMDEDSLKTAVAMLEQITRNQR